MTRQAKRPLVLGVTGGSGSGKSRLASFIKEGLGGRAAVVCQDWYYRNNEGTLGADREALNFDHPRALETPLCVKQLDALLAGRTVQAPVYDYATHARRAETREVAPQPLIIVEGLFVLHEPALRRRLDLSVFIEVPDDMRLLRRVRRDSVERRVDLEETLRLYERFVRPMHQRFIAPSSKHATWRWPQLEEERFKARLLSLIKKKLVLT
ncbi:MAG: uridine kinase [Elusimicrobia bacterium]|nr:uridine kinase [Elusimicrobiota bacterium]